MATVNTTNAAENWTANHFKPFQALVEDFHHKMNQPVNLGFDNCSDEILDLRSRLINEEWDELNEATERENCLKEMADLMYVMYGACVTFGWDLDEAFRRVHASNMSKLVDGKPLLREDGKVLKGPNYQPAYTTDLVN